MKVEKLERYKKGDFVLTDKHVFACKRLLKIKNKIINKNNLRTYNLIGGSNPTGNSASPYITLTKNKNNNWVGPIGITLDPTSQKYIDSDGYNIDDNGNKYIILTQDSNDKTKFTDETQQIFSKDTDPTNQTSIKNNTSNIVLEEDKYNLVNSNKRLINLKDQLLNSRRKPIDEKGYLIDDNGIQLETVILKETIVWEDQANSTITTTPPPDGNFIDSDGNRIDVNGIPLDPSIPLSSSLQTFKRKIQLQDPNDPNGGSPRDEDKNFKNQQGTLIDFRGNPLGSNGNKDIFNRLRNAKNIIKGNKILETAAADTKQKAAADKQKAEDAANAAKKTDSNPQAIKEINHIIDDAMKIDKNNVDARPYVYNSKGNDYEPGLEKPWLPGKSIYDRKPTDTNGDSKKPIGRNKEVAGTFVTPAQFTKWNEAITKEMASMKDDMLVNSDAAVFKDLMRVDEEIVNIFTEYQDLSKSKQYIGLKNPEEVKKNLLNIQKSLFNLQVKIIFSKLRKIKKSDINPLLNIINKKIEAMNSYIEEQENEFDKDDEDDAKKLTTIPEIIKILNDIQNDKDILAATRGNPIYEINKTNNKEIIERLIKINNPLLNFKIDDTLTLGRIKTQIDELGKYNNSLTASKLKINNILTTKKLTDEINDTDITSLIDNNTGVNGEDKDILKKINNDKAWDKIELTSKKYQYLQDIVETINKQLGQTSSVVIPTPGGTIPVVTPGGTTPGGTIPVVTPGGTPPGGTTPGPTIVINDINDIINNLEKIVNDTESQGSTSTISTENINILNEIDKQVTNKNLNNNNNIPSISNINDLVNLKNIIINLKNQISTNIIPPPVVNTILLDIDKKRLDDIITQFDKKNDNYYEDLTNENLSNANNIIDNIDNIDKSILTYFKELNSYDIKNNITPASIESLLKIINAKEILNNNNYNKEIINDFLTLLETNLFTNRDYTDPSQAENNIPTSDQQFLEKNQIWNTFKSLIKNNTYNEIYSIYLILGILNK